MEKGGNSNFLMPPPDKLRLVKPESSIILLDEVNFEPVVTKQISKEANFELVEMYLRPQGVKSIQEVNSKNPSLATQNCNDSQVLLDPQGQNLLTYNLNNYNEERHVQMELSNPFQYCNCAKVLLVDDEPFNLIVLEGLFN